MGSAVFAGDVAGAHIDLKRWNYQLWHRKLRITLRSKFDEVFAGLSVPDINVFRALADYSGLTSGPPAFFHAPVPPVKLMTGVSPISIATTAAMADRPPEAQ